MAKRYIRINFQNSPSTTTPLNNVNLNKIDKGIDDCENAIEDLYNVKFSKSDIVQTDTVNDTTKVASAAVTYVHGQEIDSLNNTLSKHVPLSTITGVLPAPTAEGTFFVASADTSFPYFYGRLEIRYGSYNGEFVAIFYTTGVDRKAYYNVYVGGWTGWKQITN